MAGNSASAVGTCADVGAGGAADKLGQRELRALHVQPCTVGVGARTLGFDLGPRRVLHRDVACIQALLRRRCGVARAVLDVQQLLDPPLRRQQVEEGAVGGQQLLQPHLVDIGRRGGGGAAGGFGAQRTLVAALPGPVQADIGVDALVDEAAAADPVLQIDLRQLARQLRQRCVVGSEDVGLRRGRGANGDADVEVLARRCEGVVEGHHGLRVGSRCHGQRQAGDGQRLSYAHLRVIAATS